jgi:F0F1-type ATP synthase assembly protein I
MWASRVTTLGLEFALPALGGFWLDGRLGTLPWVTLLGSILGFTVGITHLLRIARQGSAGPDSSGHVP